MKNRTINVNGVVKFAMGAIALTSASLFFLVLGFVAYKGIGVISLDFLLNSGRYATENSGIFPGIIATLLVGAYSLLFALPIGIPAAIYLAEYATENLITKIMRFFVDCFAGMPSIVIGLFGLYFFRYVLGIRWLDGIMLGGLCVGIMILPWIIRTSEEALRAVPFSYREASIALGASKWKSVRSVALKNAYPGMATGILLGLGRAMGETAILVITVAGKYQGSLRHIFTGANLPLSAYIFSTRGSSSRGDPAKIYGAAFVLMMIILTIDVVALFLKNRYVKSRGGEE